jgi:hypothetical protein
VQAFGAGYPGPAHPIHALVRCASTNHAGGKNMSILLIVLIVVVVLVLLGAFGRR